MKCPLCGFDRADAGDDEIAALAASRMPPHLRRLTQRQYDVLRFIETCIRNDGFPPTLREIGDALAIGSVNGVNDKILALVSKGYIERAAKRSARGLRVLYGTAYADRVGLKKSPAQLGGGE